MRENCKQNLFGLVKLPKIKKPREKKFVWKIKRNIWDQEEEEEKEKNIPVGNYLSNK